MTDPVEVLARALRDHNLCEDARQEARAILAQITPALVAEAVVAERAECAKVAEALIHKRRMELLLKPQRDEAHQYLTHRMREAADIAVAIRERSALAALPKGDA